MIADTSVWVDHLRRGSADLARLLEAGDVLVHPFVIGELACGNLRNRSEILDLLAALPAAVTATDAEVLRPFVPPATRITDTCRATRRAAGSSGSR